MTGDAPLTELRERGVVVLRNAFSRKSLTGLKKAAVACFESITLDAAVPERYRFNPASHSVVLNSLMDFGCGAEMLIEPLSIAGLEPLFNGCCGFGWKCCVEQSWIRKKFAPLHAPCRGYHLQNWHQDGALGVNFPLVHGPMPAMTELITCWIPFEDCGVDSPGLEFIRHRLPGLLHFTELDDSTLRLRFPADEFWAPSLKFGDGLVFLNSTLHRTFEHQEMRHDRWSVDYRIFPA